MSNCTIETPLGIAKIIGDEDGISSVTILNSNEIITEIIPEELQDCIYQLKEYFNGEREHFSLKLNPKGSEFQNRVWAELQIIPFGKTVSYLELSKHYKSNTFIEYVNTTYVTLKIFIPKREVSSCPVPS